MITTATPRKLILEELNQKVNHLSGELSVKKVMDRLTPLERQRISVILNEIKYNANRVKNMLL